MSLPLPDLDDRRFQDLVDDAKRMIQRRCPEWTDHNVSDPGVTLVEAFATMVDQLLYRLNRIPERLYLRFLDLVDVRLLPPVAARTDVTFWLSAAQPAPVEVPAGTEVATARSELEPSVVFSTDDDLALVPCAVTHVVTAAAAGPAVDRTVEWADGIGFACFATTPAPGDTWYIGLDNAVPRCAVLLRLDCHVEGIGVDPRDPPLVWEAWTGEDWVRCEVHVDETGGLNRQGDLVLHVPPGHCASVVASHRAGWLRCRLLEPESGQPFYSAAPRVSAAQAMTIGGTVGAIHAERIEAEVLGTSDGSPGQRFDLQHRPLVRTAEPEIVDVSGNEGWQEWTAVEHFADSAADDRHIVLDRCGGEVVLGSAVRSADGALRQHGRIPPKGALLRIRRYYAGGGHAGNIAAGTLQVLRSSIPFVARVENRAAARGGVDGEDVAAAMVRGPLTLRTRDRAVTAEDHELLARQAAPDLARVHCVPVRAEEAAGPTVRLLVVPAVPDEPGAPLDFAQLRPDPEVLQRVAAELEPRRVLGTTLLVEPPFYRGVTVVARLGARRGTSPARLRAQALAAVHALLHPTRGGPDGAGWPLGRALTSGEIHARLQHLDGVVTVDDVRLFAADLADGTRAGTSTDRLELGPTEVVFGLDHQILVAEEG